MTDLWSFLLQTLTAAGCGAVLLLVKALFRDKLSPRWQFGIWAVLGLALLLPAGWGGRGALFPWPLWLETAKTALTGSYSLTRVLAPIPLPPSRLSSRFTIFYIMYTYLVSSSSFSVMPWPISACGWPCGRARPRTGPRWSGWPRPMA